MTITTESLVEALSDRQLPGGEITIESYEAVLLDEALRARPDPDGVAHPTWFVITSLRCMGISVEELCVLARQGPDDVLLFGSCAVDQKRPMRVGTGYRTTARIGEVGSRTTRDGARLDSIEVVVAVAGDDGPVGTVTSVYLFKRGAA